MATLALAAAGACKSVLPDCGCQVNPTHPGCIKDDYLLVEGRVSLSLGVPVGVEVRGTPAYAQRYANTSTAAVRPPDQCANESATQVTGRSNQTDQIAATNCGVWMAEVERTLSRAGFRVVSWDAIRGMMTNRQMPAHEAARQLNAEVLFLFNSAEASVIGAGASAQKQANFFSSDAYGHKGAPRALPNSDAEGIRNAVATKLGSWLMKRAQGGAQALSATIDATAVFTDTGEAAWFYRNSVLKQLDDQDGEAYLFIHTNQGWRFAPRQTMEQPVQVVATEGTSSGFVEKVQSEGQRDEGKVEKLELFRSVADQFVAAFRSGQLEGT